MDVNHHSNRILPPRLGLATGRVCYSQTKTTADCLRVADMAPLPASAAAASLGGRGRCLATTPIGRRGAVTSHGADLVVPTEACGVRWIRRTNAKLIRATAGRAANERERAPAKDDGHVACLSLIHI